MNLVICNATVKSLECLSLWETCVVALTLVNLWHHLAPSAARELILSANLIEILNLDRELKGISKKDIPLSGVIIESCHVILEIVIKGLEESTALLADVMEA